MNALLRLATALRPSLYSTTMLGSAVRGGVTYPGGLDQLTPSLALQSGAVTAALNFECALAGGYSRIGGYERADGQLSPSAAVFILVQVTAFTNVPAVGASVTQATSGATGTVAAVNNVAAAYYLILTQTVGAWDESHAITSGATPIGTATTTTVTLTAAETAQYLNAAADIYRSLIGAIPGTGSVIGVLRMVIDGDDEMFGFRANAGGTAVDIYQATTAGWVNVPFYKIVEFTAGGTAVPAEGQVLTQGGVTATIKRVMQRSGSTTWAGSTAAGAFIITTPAGGNFAAGAATVSTSGATCTLSGAQTTISMLPGGRIEWAKGNFGGQLSTLRAYGADGVNKCFEFDGDVLAPITTGLTDDRPTHIAYHYGFLFVSRDASITHCGPGTPYRWSSTDSGGEIAAGDTVTCMISVPGNQTSPALAVYQENNTSILYGSDPDPTTGDFKFVNFTADSGARPYSAQALSDTISFDHLGVSGLATSLNFGNFTATTYTRNLMPFIEQERQRVIASSANQTKGQYRAFFSDGYGLYLTFDGQQFIGAMPVLFLNPVTCIDTSTTANGDEVTFFGSSDGFVYQLDKGTSFDGAAIDAYITLAWDNFRLQRQIKGYKGARIEVIASAYVSFEFGYQIGYGTTTITQPAAADYAISSTSPIWDVFVWDEFYWDGQAPEPSSIDMVGSGENVQVTIASETDYIPAYTVNSITYRYSKRRGLREG